MDDLNRLSATLNQLQKSVVRIETKIETHADHELRIRHLENTMAKNAWMSSFLTAGITAGAVTLVNIMIENGATP